MMYFIDLFCGAGGVTTGVVKARSNGKSVAKVIACVNHDEFAIASHQANHKRVLHFREDIRTLDIYPIVKRVAEIRKKDKNAVICLWASLECTNFSKAKGGQPRDADSRTLAEHLFRYIEGINPDMIFIENVEEFMAWGPLDNNGKPISRRQGSDYVRWINKVQACGYQFDWRILNAADYGAYTTRKRYFAQFAKQWIKICWPTPTHAKDEVPASLFPGLLKYKPVKDVLDFDDTGKSIFNRPKLLSERTYERIYAGLIKYVAGMNKKAFLSKYYSGKPQGKNISVDGPSGAITCIDSHALVQPLFLAKYHGTGENTFGAEQPCSTLTTKDRISLIHGKFFIDKQYSSGTKHRKHHYLINMNSSTAPAINTQNPAPAITAARTHYLVNPSYQGNSQSIERPCCVVVARQDKSPLYMVAVEHGAVVIPVYDDEPEIVVRIKEFMAMYGIADIMMRMLKIVELKRIQGFSDDYVLLGNQAQQKKMLGNSCEVNQIKAIVEASNEGLMQSVRMGVAV